ENHFDINPELVACLRETGKEELLQELEFERRGLEYFYTRQRQQLGLGHAILCARPFVNDQSFVVALGDTIVGLKVQSPIVGRMIAEFQRTKPDAIIAFTEVPREDVVHYGVASPGADLGNSFELADIVEKPYQEEAPSTLAVAARYVFGPGIFDF